MIQLIQMSYQLKVIKDAPIGFWPLDETSGTTAADISGCGNNGTYYGSLTTDIFPLTSGGLSASKITNTSYVSLNVSNDYDGTLANGGLGTKHNSDNDFSLEVWFYPKITTTSLTPILADLNNQVGIFYEKGNLVFLAAGQRLDYTIPYIQRSMHVVAKYSSSNMSLYLNGQSVIEQNFSNLKFTNNALSLSIGPTLSSSDSFIVDGPAVYRYSLSKEDISKHYFYNMPIKYEQIAVPDGGIMFDISDKNIFKQFSFNLPKDQSLETYLNSDVYYDKTKKYLSFIKTDTAQSKTFVIEDYFSFPVTNGINSSKVEWYGDNGITIETSLTGESGTWVNCINGENIPQYKVGSTNFQNIGNVYFKITLTSTDTSKILPLLTYVGFYFYKDKQFVSNNSGMSIRSKIPLGGDINLAIWDYDLGTDNYPILSRHVENGIKPSEAGFYINTIQDINTVEMFFTPKTLTKNCLLYSEYNSNVISYLWSNSGAITKSNISAIYVNGVNRTSATNISSFLKEGEICHIVICLDNPISGDIWFNVKVSNNLWTNGGGKNLYKNITLYPSQLTQAQAQNHYYLYTDRASVVATDSQNSSITLTEEYVNAYDNDWVVIRNV